MPYWTHFIVRVYNNGYYAQKLIIKLYN